MSRGLKGLWLVLPIALVLSAPALGDWIAYSLPLVVMVAFWWDDWPGTRVGPNWSGWVDTLLIAAGGLVLMWIGGPATAVFGVLLQFTLVGDGWPLRDRLPPLVAGPLAVALSYAVALVLEGVLSGPLIACVAAWQVLCCVVWTPLEPRSLRHAVVIAGGLLSLGVLSWSFDAATVTALAGCVVAGGLTVGMLFEASSATATLIVALMLFVVLSAFGGERWVAHASLDALSVSIILHVAVGRRWPF